MNSAAFFARRYRLLSGGQLVVEWNGASFGGFLFAVAGFALLCLLYLLTPFFTSEIDGMVVVLSFVIAVAVSAGVWCLFLREELAVTADAVEYRRRSLFKSSSSRAPRKSVEAVAVFQTQWDDPEHGPFTVVSLRLLGHGLPAELELYKRQTMDPGDARQIASELSRHLGVPVSDMGLAPSLATFLRDRKQPTGPRVAERTETTRGGRLIALALLVASSLTFRCALATSTPRPEVREALELYGLPHTLSSVAERVPAKFTVDPTTQESSIVEERARAIVRESYDPARMLRSVESMLDRSLDSKRLSRIVDYLRSPLDRRIFAMETADPPNAQEQLREFAATLSASPPPASRVDVVQRIIRLSHQVETVMMLDFDPLLIIADAMGKECGRAPRVDEREIRANQEAQIRRNTTFVSLFVYRTATDDELTKYANWLSSSDATWFRDRVEESLAKTLRAAGEEAGRRIARAVARGHMSWCPAAPSAG